MSVQALVLIRVTDAETFARYREVGGEGIARHGGRMVARDPDPVVLEAPGEPPALAVLLSFPSLDAAQSWRSDPSLAHVHALRNAGAQSTIVILPTES
ncbi:DUF1330 domain-containing protein [Breoghania sp. L-A4]|uniref:DUF1330 domain-containing protein n=1 Tax=Breoghania sp. L-A4 TaxID=2304600 RepID=UPI000E35C482|nr:DUF1330 domain-containing protein [Breoghania sp. L-A4]AXS39102.1 DUF1330 domain-containing protein [Breoghania sp. L-A4]